MVPYQNWNLIGRFWFYWCHINNATSLDWVGISTNLQKIERCIAVELEYTQPPNTVTIAYKIRPICKKLKVWLQLSEGISSHTHTPSIDTLSYSNMATIQSHVDSIVSIHFDLTNELSGCKSELAACKSELAACKSELHKSQTQKTNLERKLHECKDGPASSHQIALIVPPPPKPKSELPEVKALMSEIEGMLDAQKDKIKGQYRDKTKKQKFNLKFAFLLGCTTNALGASKNKDGTSNFGTPHNIPGRKGKGVCLTPVEERKLPKWKKNLVGIIP